MISLSNISVKNFRKSILLPADKFLKLNGHVARLNCASFMKPPNISISFWKKEANSSEIADFAFQFFSNEIVLHQRSWASDIRTNV